MTSGEYPVYPKLPESCYHIGGTHGSLSVPDLRLWTHEETRDWWTPMSADTIERNASDPLINQIDHFSAVIQKQAEPLVSGREGLRTLQVIEAIQIAAKSKEFVEIGDLFSASHSATA